jgi:hypothetical protein
MASAAGGTSQRLKPGGAMVRSLDRKPGLLESVEVEETCGIEAPVHL